MVGDKLHSFFTSQNEFDLSEEETPEDEETKEELGEEENIEGEESTEEEVEE